ncbi:MAG: hypothetical protein QOG94_601 [Solirubrobacteraceae bacterium]|jgi:hypothetical protein|nr:hypothetical protein [Solirubrobacteraceae bacterium]MEA2138702.1 hypothetical protein [Solirubrobacteraceae bacterium]
MPNAYCPRCGAAYDSPKITANGPVCRYCLPRGDVVVLLAARSGRLRHSTRDDDVTILRDPHPPGSTPPPAARPG